MSDDSTKNKLGIWMSTSLVVGNMVGSGVFLLPASLAFYGGISIFGWIFSSLGAFFLAIVFSTLSREIPKAGGPYAYARVGYGDFVGFLVVWTYWISIWCGNAAITVALISYLSVFIPILSESNLFAILSGLGIIWLLTFVNALGIRKGGSLQLLTTVLKIIPLLLIPIGGLLFFNWDNFLPLNISTESDFSAITSTATLTLWAFLGLESATIPSGSTKNPEKTIPRATKIGTIVAALIYIVSTMSVMGIVSPEILQTSNAPFADAAKVIWGETGNLLVAGAAVISTFGALNGWILIQGQITHATASDNLFPKVFLKVSKNGTPVLGLVITSVLVSILILLNFSRGLVETFSFIILLSTLSVLLAYIFSSGTYLIRTDLAGNKKKALTRLILGSLAFTYSFWAIAGAGTEVVYWGFLLAIAGVPFYIYFKLKNNILQ